MATLALPDDVSTLVWRLVRAQLAADPVLAAAGVRLVFFDGPEANKSLTDYQGAAVVFHATIGRMDWFDETSQAGGLVVTYGAVLPGLDDEDCLNLQGAIESALYPADGGTFGQALINAGAVTGQPLFTQPLSEPLSSAGADGLQRPIGAFALELLRSLTH